MTSLVILGAGTFAADVLEAALATGCYDPIGFLVSDEAFVVEPHHFGLPVASVDRMPWTRHDIVCIGGIISPRRCAFMDDMRARGFRFASVVHPSAIVSPSATIASGCFLGAGVILGARAAVAEDVVLNRGANLGHDARVGRCATIGPGVIMAGCVTVGGGSLVGVGAVVSDHLSIGCESTVAAGAVVVKPVPAGAFVAGSPARGARPTGR